ncbi:ABC transporter substrate-binding protein [Cereibacter sp. SYSU M97828]|nr:ABC transporter substrate-binding protein [Cereibacter flavus]
MTDKLRSPTILSRRTFLAATGAASAALMLPRGLRAQDTSVLRYALSAYPPGLDPFRHQGAAANVVNAQIYRGLLSLNGEGEVVPELAESWSMDGAVLTFKLRPNATFHDGSPVTAADAKWSLEQVIAEDSTAYFVEDLRVITGMETPDDHTLVVTLEAPSLAFPKFIATPYVPVLSQAAGLESPVGAGPYKIARMEEGVSIDLEAFEGFYKEGLPRTPRLKMIAYRDESLRVAALESGDVDIIEYVPWQSMGKIEENDSMVLMEDTGPNMILNFNVTQAPFDDPRVRQAVAYAINREDIVAAAFYGRGEPLLGLPIDKDSEIASDATQNLFSYDPEKAKTLLEEAGVVGQAVRLLSSSTYAMHEYTAIVIQQYLDAVGLKVELDLPEWGARVTQGNEGRYQFAVNGSSTTVNDPDGLTAMIGTGGPSYKRSEGYSNADLDALLAEGRHETDLARRQAIYNKVATIVKEDVPLCPLTRRTQGYALRKNVEGFAPLAGSYSSYSGYCIENVVLG